MDYENEELVFTHSLQPVKCRYCGRELTRYESALRKIGDTCAEKEISSICGKYVDSEFELHN